MMPEPNRLAERTPYEVLGVAKDATAAEVKRAYRKRSSEAHPDREGGDGAEMQAVNDAYALLSDPARRRLYDQTGETKIEHLADVAKGLLGTEFSKIVDGEPWLDPIMALRGAIERVSEQSLDAYGMHVDRLRTLRNRSQSFKAREGSEDFLREIFTQRIKQAEEAMRACEKLMEAAKLARGMLEDYRFEDFLRTQLLGRFA